jgi:hypothetical protein
MINPNFSRVVWIVIGVMKTMILFRTHGMGHFVRHHGTVAVLERPHTLKVKKAQTVTVMQNVS